MNPSSVNLLFDKHLVTPMRKITNNCHLHPPYQSKLGLKVNKLLWVHLAPHAVATVTQEVLYIVSTTTSQTLVVFLSHPLCSSYWLSGYLLRTTNSVFLRTPSLTFLQNCFFFFKIYLCVGAFCLHICICNIYMPGAQRVKEGIESPGTGVRIGC